MKSIGCEICLYRSWNVQLTYRYARTGINVLDSLESWTVLEAYVLGLLVKLLPGCLSNAATPESAEVKTRSYLAGLAQPGAGM